MRSRHNALLAGLLRFKLARALLLAGLVALLLSSGARARAQGDPLKPSGPIPWIVNLRSPTPIPTAAIVLTATPSPVPTATPAPTITPGGPTATATATAPIGVYPTINPEWLLTPGAGFDAVATSVAPALNYEWTGIDGTPAGIVTIASDLGARAAVPFSYVGGLSSLGLGRVGDVIQFAVYVLGVVLAGYVITTALTLLRHAASWVLKLLQAIGSFLPF